MNREELIATAFKITELRAEIGRLVVAQKELKRLEALIDEITGVPANAPPRHVGISIEDRVAAFILDHSERDWSGEEIAQELGTKVPTTRAAISKLRKAKRLIDTTRGRVRAIPSDETKKEDSAGIELVA